MKDLSGFYIKKDDYYLLKFNEEYGYYQMTNREHQKYTTDSLEEILTLNETIKGVIYASHGCDIPC